MQDSLGQTAKVGDFIVCTDYSQTGMYYGIVIKTTPTSIAFANLKSYYWRDDYKNVLNTDAEMFVTKNTSRKMSSSLFTIINPLLDLVLGTVCTIHTHGPKMGSRGSEETIVWGDVYEAIKKEVCF